MTKSGSGNLGKVGKAVHDHHTSMMGGMEKVANANSGGVAGQSFQHAAGSGMPRSAAQQSSVKKAARASANARGERASMNPTSKASAAPMTGPRPPNPAKKGTAPGLSTGGVSLAKNNKGLLSL